MKKDPFFEEANQLEKSGSDNDINKAIDLYRLSVERTSNLKSAVRLVMLHEKYPNKVKIDEITKLHPLIFNKKVLIEGCFTAIFLFMFWISVVLLIGYLLYFLFDILSQ